MISPATPHPKGPRIPTTETSHPNDPIPHPPSQAVDKFELAPRHDSNASVTSESSGLLERFEPFDSSEESEAPSTPNTEPVDEATDAIKELSLSPSAEDQDATPKRRRASTTLISDNPPELRRLLGEGNAATRLIEKCCGGGCCFVKTLPPDTTDPNFTPVVLPDNQAFRSLGLKLGPLSLDTTLSKIPELSETTVSFDPVAQDQPKHTTLVHKHPPTFVQPHPPYDVFSAPIYHARELTKPGAEKRTFHFDLDVTDYPDESGIDFKVGGAIGVCPPNATELVDEVFDCLGIPKFVRDKPVTLNTSGGRWPTIWGEEQPRQLVTTRRELLTWCSDIQSQPPTKPLLRLMAEHASAPNEKQLLLYLSSAEGQGAFCDLRTSSHFTLPQLLRAFPSSQPPLASLLSVLSPLMPRFYSLSNDPHISSEREGGRRLIEIAVSVHETSDWHSENSKRTGVGSGFLERLAHKFIEAEASGIDPKSVLDLRVPLFRGLMANPLSREFGGDGPMMLIGAGVGMAPFRGFILNRLKNANCANKIWLVQGVRDSMLDEIYSGELGDHEKEIKRVVQSRKFKGIQGASRYVQDEVRHRADLVWFVINALDGRIFVCGSSKGMGEGVEQALVDIAMEKGNLSEESARAFWEAKKSGAQYIAETW
ncbi:hypothetical protein EJ05DRAFT_451287 [Pseudovirgaria hyperparasitica]|uniref:FAD-binding FR-type domain-containing protein n=1 Tax=Pseudovirgaria hyperparasitica TaxID=470096 RepID=A0A6A6WA03_9PEZI|nr:uncharacterized protein EJ05DRAFT_451287 [Pseudovirgaria hyperparasitica]KAF2758989.1 hypothetical protein EJ05DRAFT_451287 [Pseudovirgaria hyperparasitica]